MTSPIKEPLFEYFFVAKQPIFNNVGEIWGYELLYRNESGKQHAEIQNHDIATLCVATFGFAQAQEFCDQSKKIAINFTEKLILDGAPRGLPPEVTVVEIKVENPPNKSLIEALRSLKEEKYRIAIETHGGQVPHDALLAIADIIKIDTAGKTESALEEIFLTVGAIDCMKLAKKVDCRKSVEQLRALGCDLYQGFFFAKPVNLRGRTLKSTQVSKLRILQTIEQPDVDVQSIKESIKADPSITYRLMHFLNSAAFGFQVKIESVAHAIRMIGIKRLKYWLRMAVMVDLNVQGNTPELYVMGLNRGRFLEELVEQGQMASLNPDSMFLFGMLSLIEAMLEVPLDTIIGNLPLSDDIQSGLFDPDSTYGKYLKLVIALENANASMIEALCREMGIDQKAVAACYSHAIAWAYQMSQAMQ